MARTANSTTRPPGSFGATTKVLSDTVKEVVEMANYAVVASRVTLFDVAPSSDPLLSFPSSAGTTTAYTLPVWIDADAHELTFTTSCTMVSGNTVRVTINDGSDHHTPTISFGDDTKSVTWAPATVEDHSWYVTVILERLTGSDPIYLDRIRLVEATLDPADIPAPYE